MPCTIQHWKYLCFERTLLNFLLRKAHLTLPSHLPAPKQCLLIVLFSNSRPFTMEKTSIVQAVFSDLGLTIVVQEASKRQMTTTKWSELGHCSKHPLSTDWVTHLLASTHAWPQICQTTLGFGDKTVITSFLYCFLYVLIDITIIDISVAPSSPSKLREHKALIEQGHEAKWQTYF